MSATRRILLESRRSAQELGALAARNMLGEAAPIDTVPWFWSDQYDLTLQIAGLAEGAPPAHPSSFVLPDAARNSAAVRSLRVIAIAVISASTASTGI